jgi:hypothetical protein
MKYEHTGLIASLKDIDLPIFESEALMHSLQYYKTERYFLNKRNRINLSQIDCLQMRDMKEPLPASEIDLLTQQLST